MITYNKPSIAKFNISDVLIKKVLIYNIHNNFFTIGLMIWLFFFFLDKLKFIRL